MRWVLTNTTFYSTRMNGVHIKWSSFPAVVRKARCGGCLRESEMENVVGSRLLKTPTGVNGNVCFCVFRAGVYQAVPHSALRLVNNCCT